MENVQEVFEKFDDDFLKFDLIENKMSNRTDLHAFMMLDKLFPGTGGMVSAAEHDEIYLDVDEDDFEKSDITEYQVRDLVRCGVRLGEYGICMFV